MQNRSKHEDPTRTLENKLTTQIFDGCLCWNPKDFAISGFRCESLSIFDGFMQECVLYGFLRESHSAIDVC